MKKAQKQISVITLFVMLNLMLGRLFQESLSLVCVSELFIVAITSFVFWNASSGLINKASSKWKVSNSKKNFAIQTGLALSTSIVNVLITQGVIILAMLYIYNCTSPSFGFINASLTNNIAINLLCYFALIHFFVEKEVQSTTNLERPITEEIPKKLVLSSGNKQHIILLEDINYVETSNNCIILYTSKGQFVKYQSLSSFLKQYKSPFIKRIHKSYAVNEKQIDMIEKNKNGDGLVFLKDKNKVKFSRTYKSELLN